MFKVGEMVRWRYPQEPMYSYGVIQYIQRNKRAIITCKDYAEGLTVSVHLRYIRKLEKGGKGGGDSK